MNISDRVAIVCTDRGQHERVRLTTVRWDDDGTGHFHVTSHASPPDRGGRSSDPGWSRSSYHFDCPRCARTPQIDSDRFWQLVAAARRVAMPMFDLSHLD